MFGVAPAFGGLLTLDDVRHRPAAGFAARGRDRGLARRHQPGRCSAHADRSRCRMCRSRRPGRRRSSLRSAAPVATLRSAAWPLRSAIRIRPNTGSARRCAGPLVVEAACVPLHMGRERGGSGSRPQCSSVSASLPGVVTTAAIMISGLFGSPMTSGYGDLSGSFAWHYVSTENVRCT